MKTGVELIAEERQRQITYKGWITEYDDQHKYGQLAAAGSWYSDMAVAQTRAFEEGLAFDLDEMKFETMEFWPWDEVWCKPSTDPIRNLVKSGALIAAEIDRLQRLRAVTEISTAQMTRPMANAHAR